MTWPSDGNPGRVCSALGTRRPPCHPRASPFGDFGTYTFPCHAPLASLAPSRAASPYPRPPPPHPTTPLATLGLARCFAASKAGRLRTRRLTSPLPSASSEGGTKLGVTGAQGLVDQAEERAAGTRENLRPEIEGHGVG